MMAQIHIKRDGRWLCGVDPKEAKKIYFHRHDQAITFKQAHNTDLKIFSNICKECVKEYYDRLARAKDPIIV